MPKTLDTDTELALRDAWERDIAVMAPSRLPRPRLVIKRGWFSPWFAPWVWSSRSGVYNFLCWIIVSEDLLSCTDEHRRAIVAHECGHWAGFHGLIWLLMTVVLLHSDKKAVASAFGWIGKHAGGGYTGAGIALLSFMVAVGLCMFGAMRVQYFFEHTADDYAARLLGRDSVADTLEWLNEFLFVSRGQEPSAWVARRVARLRSQA